MTMNVPNPSPIKVNEEDLPTTKEFTYCTSEHYQAWRQSRQRHQELPQKGQEHLQNAKQYVEGIPV